MQIRYYFCFHFHIKYLDKLANRLTSIFFPIKIHVEQVAPSCMLYIAYFFRKPLSLLKYYRKSPIKCYNHLKSRICILLSVYNSAFNKFYTLKAHLIPILPRIN